MLIFNNCFINFNFKFLIEIKGSIAILKIFRLIEHKIYEISLIEHNYHFFGLKKPFSLFFTLLLSFFLRRPNHFEGLVRSLKDRIGD